MTCRPFFCDHAADCPDLACEGHPIVILPRVPGVHTDEGGKAVQGGFAVSLAMPLAEVPEVRDEPITTPDEAEGWARAWQRFFAFVAVACLAAVAVAYFNS